MWVIKKHQDGTPITKLTEIEAHFKNVLKKMYVDGMEVGYKDRIETVELLETVRERGCWIECDCDPITKPILTVVKKENGEVFLRHVNTRGRHQKTCDFREIQYKKQEKTNHLKKTARLSLDLHKKFARGYIRTGKRKEEYKARRSSGNMGKLARVLYTFIEEAGINRIRLPFRDMREQYGAIKRVASMYELSPGILASDLLFTFPNQIKRSAVIIKKSRYRWKNSCRPYGVFIFTADEITVDNKLICKTKNDFLEIKVHGVLTKSSGRLGDISSPYLVIMTVTDLPESPRYYRPVNAFVVPVCSKGQLVPVDSSHERRVLRKLNELLYWWEKRGHTVEIKKPLFGVEIKDVPDNIVVKPDFILSCGNLRISLEVMGSIEHEYVDRKKRTHKYMEAVGPVVEFDAIRANTNEKWMKEERRMIANLMNLFDGSRSQKYYRRQQNDI